MRDDGFEALADGTLLLTVLLVASALVMATGPPASSDARSEGLRYAEDTRLALFRTTVDGLGYTAGGTFVAFPNGTSLDAFLRMEAHLRSRPVRDLDFSLANGKIANLTARLLRPGWLYSITARVGDNPTIVCIPEGCAVPETRFESGWAYPALDDSSEGTRLTLAVWPSPLR